MNTRPRTDLSMSGNARFPIIYLSLRCRAPALTFIFLLFKILLDDRSTVWAPLSWARPSRPVVARLFETDDSSFGVAFSGYGYMALIETTE